MGSDMSFVSALFLVPDAALAKVYANARRKESWCYENGYLETAVEWDRIADAVLAEAGARSDELKKVTLTKALRLGYSGEILR